MINFVKPTITINGDGSEEKTFKFYEQGFELNGSISEPTYRDVTISGQMSLTLLNAKADSLEYLKAFGKCEQAETPTPSNPVPIWCNNGKIKARINLAEDFFDANITSGGKISSNSIYKTFTAPVEPGKTYTVDKVVVIAYFTSKPEPGSASYDGSRIVTLETTFTVPNDPSITYVAVRNDQEGGILCEGTSIPNLIYTDGTVETVEIIGKNLFDVSVNPLTQGGILSNSGQDTKDTVSSYNLRVRTNGYIPVKPNTIYTASVKDLLIYYLEYAQDTTYTEIHSSGFVDNSVTFTTGANTYFIRLQFRKSDNSDIEPSEVTNVQLEQGSTATTYEPYFVGGTATTENLLSVGNFEDVQSILDGGVTRNVGVKVLDGSETWTKGGSYNQFYSTNAITDRDISASNIGYCTHYTIGSETTDLGKYGYLRFGVTTQQINFSSVGLSATTVAQWKQFLATQYANGTPVIIVYPLATPTTETVTPQPLTIQEGTNIIEVIQSSIDDLELEAQYKAGVGVTIAEIQNVNLDNSVTVTIS